MGLDMYLTRKNYVGATFEHRKVTGSIEVFIDGEKLPIDFNKVIYIDEELGYWRKANAIHKWFVDNVQDGEDECQESYVTDEKLRELLDVVNRVLEDHSLAEELLPSESGFFFGGTEYDERYFRKLEDTKEILVNALGGSGDIYYHASW